jgi:hypothetical protein
LHERQAGNAQQGIHLANQLQRKRENFFRLEFPMQALVWTARFSLLAVLAIVLCGSPVSAADVVRAADEAQSAEEALSADDGWRRTALGWERTQVWSEPTNRGRPRDRFLFADDYRQTADRWDFHPAWLVGLQLVAITLGFAAWSRAIRISSTRFRRGARTALCRDNRVASERG